MSTLLRFRYVIYAVVLIAAVISAYFYGKSSAKRDYDAAIEAIQKENMDKFYELKSEVITKNTEVTNSNATLTKNIAKAKNELKALPVNTCKLTSDRLLLIQKAYSDTNTSITGR